MGWQIKSGGWDVKPGGFNVEEASPLITSCCCCTCRYCSHYNGRVWCCLLAIIDNLNGVDLDTDEYLEACTQSGSSASAPAWPLDLKFCVKAKPRALGGVSLAKMPYYRVSQSPEKLIYQPPAIDDVVLGNSSSSSTSSPTSGTSSSSHEGGSCSWWGVIQLDGTERLFDFYGSGVGDGIFDLPQFLHIGITIREDKIVMGASVVGPGTVTRVGGSTISRGNYGGLGIAIYAGEKASGCALEFGDQWDFGSNQLVAGLESPDGISRLVGYTGGSAIAEPGCTGEEDELYLSSSSTSGAADSYSSVSSASSNSSSSSSSSSSSNPCLSLSHGERFSSSAAFPCAAGIYVIRLQFSAAWTGTIPNIAAGCVRIKDDDGNWYYSLAGSGAFSDAYATNSGGNGFLYLSFASQPGDGSGSCSRHKFQSDPLTGPLLDMEVLFSPSGLTPEICTYSGSFKGNYP